MHYQTDIVDSPDGTSTLGIAYRYNGLYWERLGYTRQMRVYPRCTRARVAAENICRRYHKRNHAQLPLTLVKA